MGNKGTDEVQRLDAGMKTNEITEPEWEWHSPHQPPIRVTGLPWFGEEGLYRRLPLQPPEPIRPEVDRLADYPAGAQLRLATDSPKLAVRVELAAPAGMYQMPATGQCGIDCYVGPTGSMTYVGTAKFAANAVTYDAVLFDGAPAKWREVTLNLPLYQGVRRMAVGLAPSAGLRPFAGFASGKRVLLYGTSITHGACATRPGMAYPNVLSRMLPLEFVSFGFSGNAQGEPEVARLIAGVEEPALLVLDYEGNTPSTERLAATLPAFIAIFRERHPDVPILVVSQIPLARESYDDDMLQRRLARKRVQLDTVERLRAAGDFNVHFRDGESLLGDDWHECTTDGIHPSDLGYYRIAHALRPAIAGLLRW